MKLYFCSDTCKTQFNRDVSDGTLVNTKSIKLIGKGVCTNCFEEKEQPKHASKKNKASLSVKR